MGGALSWVEGWRLWGFKSCLFLSHGPLGARESLQLRGAHSQCRLATQPSELSALFPSLCPLPTLGCGICFTVFYFSAIIESGPSPRRAAEPVTLGFVTMALAACYEESRHELCCMISPLRAHGLPSIFKAYRPIASTERRNLV